MIFVRDGEMHYSGSVTQLMTDITVAIHCLMEQEGFTKKEFEEVIRLASMSDEELTKESDDKMLNFMESMIDELGSDNAGDFLNMILGGVRDE